MNIIVFAKQFILKILFLCLAYFASIKSIFYAIWILMLIDLFTGIWKSLKTRQKIKSHGLRQTVIKLLFYTLSVIVVHIVDVTFLKSSGYLARIAGGYIAVTEVVSIFENISVITGQSVFKKIMDIIKQSITDKLTRKNGS